MKVPTKLVSTLGKVGRALKAKSPQIAMGVGAITSVVAVVEAIKQTPKAMEVIEAHKEEAESYKHALEIATEEENYGVAEYRRDLIGLCGRTGIKIAKIYAIPAVMELTSLACFFGAHKIMSQRNQTLAAALAATTDAYNAYRNKVIEAIGEEKEEKIRLGLKDEKVQTEITDEKTGKSKIITNRITSFDPKDLGPYDILWQEGDPGYDQSEELRNAFASNIAKEFTNWIYDVRTKDNIPLYEITKYFNGDLVARSRQLHMIAGYKQTDKDQAVIIKRRPVEVWDKDHKFYHEGEVLSFNVQGSLVPDYIK